MTRTTWALIIKFPLTFVAAWLAFGAFGANPLRWVFIVALIGTVLNHVFGDLVLLPGLGNVMASVADGLLAAVVAHITSLLVQAFTTTFRSLVVFAVLVLLAEYGFHIYLARSRHAAP